jgi:hypothetical protein
VERHVSRGGVLLCERVTHGVVVRERLDVRTVYFKAMCATGEEGWRNCPRTMAATITWYQAEGRHRRTSTGSGVAKG